MSDTAPDKKTLLTKLRNAVWGNQAIFKRSLPVPGTENSSTVDYLDFGEHFVSLKLIAPTISAPQFLVREEYRQAIKTFEGENVAREYAKGEDTKELDVEMEDTKVEDAKGEGTNDDAEWDAKGEVAGDQNVYAGGACIMGQPGIGKSCFIAYGVIEMLRSRRPVAVQILPEGYTECYALFSEDGLGLHPGDAQEPLRSHKGIWAFSDSNADVQNPAIAFRTTPNVRVFQTTSPRIERWKEWTKQCMVTRYIMDVWSTEEITTLATILNLNVDRMNELASRWGPVPRTLLQHYNPDQERLLESSMRSIAFEAIPRCRHILRSMSSLSAPVDPGPSSIFFIRPESVRGAASHMPHFINIPTETIANMLGVAVCAAAEGDRHDFFNAMIGSPGTRAAAGYIFETWIHTFLSNGNTTLECHWHSKSKSSPPVLPSASQIVYTIEELRTTKGTFYWPPLPGFPGIDGALFHEKDVYAIQITVKTKHTSPQLGLNELCRILGEDRAKKLRWSVLFIGNKLVQSEIVSKKYVGKLYIDPSGKGTQPKKPKFIPVGWCTTSPVHTDLTVLTTLTNYPPTESADQ